ncbi:MAG: ABC transporter substrate-binding protein [Spirochaetaceae bacterium]|jgi:hypothetical protein|nr:ABC transporter substrate-binding protein [Spirochaetaceae bacterium]
MVLSSRARILRRLIPLFLALVMLPPLGARGKKETPNTAGKRVVASTSWVAAVARASGAEDVRVLAPLSFRHPPEYELKPSDLAAAAEADLIIYAAWEPFASRLADTAGSAGTAQLVINPTNSPEALLADARKIAAVLGTEERCEAWWRTFEPFAEGIRAEVDAAYPVKRAVVQRMQSPFARWLGFEPAGEYGPAEPSPAVILEMVRLGPALVIDNYHGPSGRPIAEASGAAYAELINFPGKDGTLSLEDVFRYNARILLEAAR